MKYDVYGRPETSPNYRLGKLEIYRIDEASESVTYFSYFDGGSGTSEKNVLIRRHTVSGAVTTVEKAYGKWSERSSLSYIPINDTLEV